MRRLGKSRAHYSVLDHKTSFFYVLFTRPSPKAEAELKWARCFAFGILFIIIITIFKNADWFARCMSITCPGPCFQCELMAKYENYGFARSVRSTVQVDSDKLRNELHS